jgi:heptosyltransferase-2
MNRILVIRGGAIGDFILTLPALKVLRDAYSDAHIEILGYKHIAVLAENRFYAQAVRSIEYSALSSFFAKNSEPSLELASYFESFDLVISYLYDPDRIFEVNLRRCGADELIQGPAQVNHHEHAARQLARPLEEVGLFISDFAAKLYPSVEDRRVAETFLGNCAQPIIALHPGSGSGRKNWPLENWIAFGNYLLHFEDFPGSLLIISGEADEERTRQLQTVWKDDRVRFAKNLPLPELAALLENAVFVGHDSGISHLAAAAGARCILLFGSTDPDVWAPRNENVRVLRARNGNVDSIGVAEVESAVATAVWAA